MKWIGQHVWDFISRFRSDVYLENISTGTIASGGNLGLDSNNKIVKAAEVGSSVDLASEVTGTLPVANGGTGATSFTDNYVLTGTGTSAITAESELQYNSGTNKLTIGGNDLDTVWIQRSAHSDGTGGALIVKAGSASVGQTDTAGGSLSLVAGQSTGTGNFGSINFSCGVEAASTGTGLNNNATISQLKSNGTTETWQSWYEKAGASTDDFFRIVVAEHGATTLKTNDTASHAADLTIEADGDAEIAADVITLDSAGAITLERGSSTVEVPDVTGTLQVVDLVQYLLPSDFIGNDAMFVRGYLYAADDAGSDYGGTWQDAGIEAWAWYQIPKGFKVTHMHAYGNTTSLTDASIYQLDPTDGTRGSALASGAWNQNRSLSTAITSADDAVALVVLNPNAATDIIYSVKLTLALV
tara:strand:+ start:74 stop:1315 length:1242 start_codon:yes stop_codon:yes gene_type:complete